jgi:hypothetical protein
MKKIFLSYLFIIALGILHSCDQNKLGTTTKIDSADYSGNPIIKHKFTADPAAMVYNNTVYLFTGHDEAPD